MKKHRSLLTFILIVTCCIMTAFPAFAGEWIEVDDKQWQYMDDEDELAIGWQDIDEKRYYFDDEGYRISGRWEKISRYWYYFDEDGVLAVDTWVDNYHVDVEGRKDKAR